MHLRIVLLKGQRLWYCPFVGCGTLTIVPHLLIIASWKFNNHALLSPGLYKLMALEKAHQNSKK